MVKQTSLATEDPCSSKDLVNDVAVMHLYDSGICDDNLSSGGLPYVEVIGYQVKSCTVSRIFLGQ